jgi:nicotinate-nucleotide adenylyltransferase
LGDFVKKIGLLGGTFDPIHFGHIHLGISLQEAYNLDKVIVCPAYSSPLKTAYPQASEDRLAMVELAIEDLPSWEILDWEIHRKVPSYTIDTVRHLFKTELHHSRDKLFLLLGEDLLPGLPKWKEVDELMELATPLIGCRRPERNTFDNPFAEKISNGITPLNVLEISASDIRNRLKKGLYCNHLMPAKVLDYIKEHRLY